MDNNKPEAKERSIVLCDRIDEHSARDVIKQIIEINSDDEKSQRCMSDGKAGRFVCTFPPQAEAFMMVWEYI